MDVGRILWYLGTRYFHICEGKIPKKFLKGDGWLDGRTDVRSSGSLRIQWILMDGMDGWVFTNKMIVILGRICCCYTYRLSAVVALRLYTKVEKGWID